MLASFRPLGAALEWKGFDRDGCLERQCCWLLGIYGFFMASPWLFPSARSSWTLQGAFLQLEQNGLIRVTMWEQRLLFHKFQKNTIFRLFHGNQYATNKNGYANRVRLLGTWLSHCGALNLRSVFGSRGMFDPVEFRWQNFRKVHTLVPRHDQGNHDMIRCALCSVEMKDVLFAALSSSICIDPSWHAWYRFIFQKPCETVLYIPYISSKHYACAICT